MNEENELLKLYESQYTSRLFEKANTYLLERNALFDERDKLYKEIDKLEEQLEAYKNMRKEAIEYIHDKLDRFDCDGNLSISMQITYCEEDLLNILNKVGGSDE